MLASLKHETQTLSVIIPCFNESATLERCVERVLEIADGKLSLEIIIVDDCSTDNSQSIAQNMKVRNKEIRVFGHKKNQGKGAALRTGINHATGDFIAVQDADLEYNPRDLKRLLEPLFADKADVVLGSRFLSPGAHRVLYFWHSVANKILTLVSNMLSDMNLTDMECGYKVFRSDVLKNINIEEDRFGFEPEIIAKIAHKRLRIYEMAVSYDGRTYAEGKKIGWKDAFRAFYCILHYNLPFCSFYIQLFFYIFIGAAAAAVNLAVFLIMLSAGITVNFAAPVAFFVAALVNYVLSIAFVFRHKAKWNSVFEMAVYFLVVTCVAVFDLWVTKTFLSLGYSAAFSKAVATALALVLNFSGRRYLVFPSTPRSPWGGRDRGH